MMQPIVEDQLRQQFGADKAQQVTDINTRASQGVARVAGQMAVGLTPYVGTTVGVAQDMQTFRSGSGASGFEKVLAMRTAVIRSYAWIENIHGEINAVKTVVKEADTSVRETAEAANAVAKDAASATAHDATSVDRSASSGVQPGLDDGVSAVPNPNGRNGGPAHQAKVAEVEKGIESRGLTSERDTW